jgi:Uma2 family endonuclease
MATISYPTIGAAHVELPLSQFTADEYMTMVEAGALGGQRRVELIGGYIVDVSPAGARHNYVVQHLSNLLAPLKAQFEVWVQATLEVSKQNVYDPDIMVLKPPIERYQNTLPIPADVELIIEVADSSRLHDALVKLPVYAKAGIREYWIVDITKECVIVHRQPHANRYADVEEFCGETAFSPLAASQLIVPPTHVLN